MTLYLGFGICLGLLLLAIVAYIVIKKRNKRKKMVCVQLMPAREDRCQPTGSVRRRKRVNMRKRQKVTSKQGVTTRIEESCMDVFEVIHSVPSIVLPKKSDVSRIIAIDQYIQDNNIHVRTEDVDCLTKPLCGGAVNSAIEDVTDKVALVSERQGDPVGQKVVVNRVYKRRA